MYNPRRSSKSEHDSNKDPYLPGNFPNDLSLSLSLSLGEYNNPCGQHVRKLPIAGLIVNFAREVKSILRAMLVLTTVK